MSEQETTEPVENSGEIQAEEQVGADTQESGAGEKSAEPTPEAKIAELEAKLAEAGDQYLRKAADFENFRKRMNQEKQSAIEFANQSLLLDIIPIIDDFERAIIAGDQAAKELAEQASAAEGFSKDFLTFLEGIKMIEKRLTTQLEHKWGLKRFISAGEVFDPNLHEAFVVEKSPDVTEAVVQEDLFKGYYLKERVIRAAKVKVLMPDDSIEKKE